MMTKPTPYAAIVSEAETEEEQTRIFSRVLIDDTLREPRPAHRYVAIAIPAFFNDEESLREEAVSWPRTVGLVLWGCSLSIIGTALFVALGR